MGKRKQSASPGKGPDVQRIISLAGNPPDLDLAVMVIAERLLDGVSHPPTDLEELAKRLNVNGFEAEMMPLSGELRRVGRQFRVFYSTHLTQHQRRFTIAHELGHAVFAMTGPRYPRGGEEVERICDMLAAEFLMPTAEFQNRLEQDLTAEKLFELTAVYKAPILSIARRVAEFQRLSVFTVEDRDVTWTYGTVAKGPFHKNDYYLKTALDKVTESPSGDITFPISGVARLEGRLTWVPIANGKKALCLLRKMPDQTSQTLPALLTAPDGLRA